jgi:hypothetical protein
MDQHVEENSLNIYIILHRVELELLIVEFVPTFALNVCTSRHGRYIYLQTATIIQRGNSLNCYQYKNTHMR